MLSGYSCTVQKHEAQGRLRGTGKTQQCAEGQHKSHRNKCAEGEVKCLSHAEALCVTRLLLQAHNSFYCTPSPKKGPLLEKRKQICCHVRARDKVILFFSLFFSAPKFQGCDIKGSFFFNEISMKFHEKEAFH
jgi:hypothetical protein